MSVKLAQYKYSVPKEYMTRHGSSYFIFWIVAIFFTLFGFLTLSLFGAIPCIILFSILKKKFFGSNNMLFVSSRYLIMGDRIIYYNNLEEVVVKSSPQRYELIPKNGSKHSIHASSFPTGARKEWKIAKNRKEKFDKITGKISNHIRENAPHVTFKTGAK